MQTVILVPHTGHLLQNGSLFFFSSLLIAVSSICQEALIINRVSVMSQIVNTVMSLSQGCRLDQVLAYQGQQQVERSDGVEQLCRNYS